MDEKSKKLFDQNDILSEQSINKENLLPKQVNIELAQLATDIDCCPVCTINPKTIMLEKCKFPDEKSINAIECPTLNKELKLTINFNGLCPKGLPGFPFTRLAVCVTINKPYQTVPSTLPFATQNKIIDLPAFDPNCPNKNPPCGSKASADFCFCLDEGICSTKSIDVKVCSHYVY